jgi:hypothetical protein
MIPDSRIRRLFPCVLPTVLLLGLGAPGTARAQGEAPTYELFLGYAPLRDLDAETNLPVGWNVSVARGLTSSLGVVADFGGNYKTVEGVDLNLHAILGGVRYTIRSARVNPYLEALAGATRLAASANGVSDSSTDFAVQGGVGLGIKVTDNLWLRTGLDYRNIFAQGGSIQELRALFGVTLGLGGSLGGGGSAQPRASAAPAGRSSAPSGYSGGAPNWEMSANYAFLRDQDIKTNFPLGWSVSVARNVANSVGIVADMGGNYRTVNGVDLKIHALLGGVRYTVRGERLTPYIEALAGAARLDASAAGVTASGTDFAVQGGIGFGVRVAQNVWLRAGGDFRNIFSEGQSVQEFRAFTGVSFGFGGTRPGPSVPEPPPPPPPVRAPARESYPQAQQPETAPAPAPRPAPAEAPAQPARPPVPATPALGRLAQGHEALRAGSYAQASDAFRDYLGVYAPYKVTIPVGLYCEPANVAQQVSNAGGSEELFLLQVMNRGRLCYGLYWGVFGSRSEAAAGIHRLPPALRVPGQAPISVSKILSRAR